MCLLSSGRAYGREDKLLALHRNVTRVQEQLLKAMDTSLDEVWRTQAEQKAFSGSWKEFLSRVMGDVEDLQDGILEKVRMGGTRLESMLSQLLDRIMDAQTENTVALERMDMV
jgi:hypothetical protein